MQVSNDNEEIDGINEELLSETSDNQQPHELSQPENTTYKPLNKRQKLMSKKKEDPIVAEAYSYLKSVTGSQPDEASIFGDLIASKIRKLPMSVRPIAQHAILSTLLDYEIGHGDRPHSTSSNATSIGSNSIIPTSNLGSPNEPVSPPSINFNILSEDLTGLI